MIPLKARPVCLPSQQSPLPPGQDVVREAHVQAVAMATQREAGPLNSGRSLWVPQGLQFHPSTGSSLALPVWAQIFLLNVVISRKEASSVLCASLLLQDEC